MAKKQSRRSVSLNRNTYERLRTYCETNHLAMSEFVESRIGEFLGRPEKAIERSSKDKESRREAARFFTF